MVQKGETWHSCNRDEVSRAKEIPKPQESRDFATNRADAGTLWCGRTRGSQSKLRRVSFGRVSSELGRRRSDDLWWSSGDDSSPRSENGVSFDRAKR
jgi:hypothetical protein